MLIGNRLKNESTDVNIAPDVVFGLWTFRMRWKTFSDCAVSAFFREVLSNQLEDIEVSVGDNHWSGRKESVVESSTQVWFHLQDLKVNHILVPPHPSVKVKCDIKDGFHWTLQSCSYLHHDHWSVTLETTTLFEVRFIELNCPLVSVLALVIGH